MRTEIDRPDTRTAPLRIGTRGSDLAVWQARRVANLLQEKLGHPAELVVISTKGDRIQNVSFHKMEGKGFFTKELQEALLDGRVDLVVHSLKDLPTEEPDGLEVVAVPERTTAADLLIARNDSLHPTLANPLGLAEDARLGTSSLRRAAQALALQPDLRVKALRGNVPTRIRKLREGQYDAILLAAAGVRRLELNMDDLDVRELPPELMLPAAGQGALAIEVRRGDPATKEIGTLHDSQAGRLVHAERHLLGLMGGGCHLPLGCLATAEEDGIIRLQAVLGVVDEGITRAVVTRVAAVAPDPETAARTCRLALLEAQPSLPEAP
ncbi:MAG: hydroxymethylbilane synthase [Acidobacteria bacterium]|nr:MAG: hydroxymethylbilane synthase [Acidobacteriota bacterium]